MSATSEAPHRPLEPAFRRAAAARRWSWGRIFAVALLVLAICVGLLPFVYLLSASLKDSEQLFSYPPQWIPSPFTLDNYQRLFSSSDFLRWTWNTMLVALSVTALKLLFDSMAAYALAKLRFTGRRLLVALIFATIMVPPAVLLLPLFFIVRDLGLLNTYWALILPPLANPIGIVILRGFILSLPDDLDNAAQIDNCNPFQIYWHVILPLIRPALVVVGIYLFLVQYTAFIWPLVAAGDITLITTGLAQLRPHVGRTDWGLITSGSVMALVPITIVFLMFQRQFVSANFGSAFKG